MAGGIAGIFLVQACPRVLLSMVMMTLMSLSMAALGCVHYIQDSQPDSSTAALDIIPVLAVTLYMFCFGAGQKADDHPCKYADSLSLDQFPL